MTNTVVSGPEVSGRAGARGALMLVLSSAIGAWLLFVAGVYVDLQGAGEPARYTTELGPTPLSFARFVFFAAVAVLGLGSLVALRRTSAMRAAATSSQVPLTSLARPVQLFAATSLIVATAISAFTCIGLFFGGFIGGGSPATPLTQTVNLYLPIVLHTALVVTLVLAGFVFTPRANSQRAVDVSRVAAAPAATPDEGDTQRTAALGFAVPVITASAALIAGLIVADVTGSATQVWLWAIVLAVIGAGIVAGTRAAQRAIAQQPDPLRPRGAAVGAKNLNFVLSIVLVAAASVMSLGYGASAVGSLRSSPWVSGGVYDDASADTNTSMEWSASGSDLRAGSTLTVTLLPVGTDSGGTELATGTVDRDGWGDASGPLDLQDAPGDYTIEITALARDGREVTSRVPFTITERGLLEQDASADTYTDFASVLTPVTARWVFADLVPAGLLLVIAAAVVALTVTQRAREYDASQPGGRSPAQLV
ncbi:hypothetical protein ACXR2T_09655 [Leucobacter sp. HY1910]